MSEFNQKINDKDVWKRFFYTCKVAKIPYGTLAVYILISLAATTVLIKIPQINADFFNGDASVRSVAMFLGAELLTNAMVQFELYYAHLFRYRTDRNLRNVLWEKILKVKPKYYDQVSANTLLSRITIDTSSLNEFIIDIILGILFSIYSLVLTIKEMSDISLKAAFGLLVFVPVSLGMSYIIGRIDLRIGKKMKGEMSNLTEYLSELVASIPLIKAFNRQDYETQRGHQVVNNYYKANRTYTLFDVLKQIIGTVVSIVPTVVIIMMGIRLLNNATLDAAGWYVFYVYSGSLLSFVSQLGSYWEKTKGVQGNLYTVSSVLFEQEEGIEHYVQEVVNSEDMCFDEVSFGYDEKMVLIDASFTIPKNRTTALVGYSGVGKSTVLKLIERIYEPNKGRILIGNRNLEDYSLKAYREKLSFVAQSAPMISGSIRDNITYGIKHEISDDQIMEAAKLVHLEEFILSCPDGLNHPVGQFGSKISGGQRQKISIARAILADTEYLILDEPTASLDIISTVDIADTIRSLSGKMTIILVSHHSEIVQTADHIVIFEKDHQIIESDRRNTVISSDFYSKLMELQQEDK